MTAVLPTTFSEAIALYLRRPDLENQYLYPQIFSAMMFIGAAIALYLLRVWKLGDRDRRDREKPREDAAVPGSDVSRWWRWAVV